MQPEVTYQVAANLAPTTPLSPHLELAAVLNAVADDILHVTDASDEGLRDALNLCVNAAAYYWEKGWQSADPTAARDRLEQVAASNYDTELDTILSWIDAGIR